jgi:hypothetical protein
LNQFQVKNMGNKLLLLAFVFAKMVTKLLKNRNRSIKKIIFLPTISALVFVRFDAKLSAEAWPEKNVEIKVEVQSALRIEKLWTAE